MKPSAFAYSAPESLDEALAVLADVGGDAKVLAGGQSLLPILNMRLAAPADRRRHWARSASSGTRPARVRPRPLPGGTVTTGRTPADPSTGVRK